MNLIYRFGSCCSVCLIDAPKYLKKKIDELNIKHHKQEVVDVAEISVSWVAPEPKSVSQYLHPNAIVDDKGFGFLDEEGFVFRTSYSCDMPINLEVEVGFSASLFWEILFDHIKYVLLMQNVVTVHAAGYKEEGTANLLFGWDGVGKSSMLLDKLQDSAEFLGDDRLFLSKEGIVYPLFSEIKQFYHEIEHYPQVFNLIGYKQKFFIRLSQRIHKSSLGRLKQILLKLLRKLSLTFVKFNCDAFGAVYNSGVELGNLFFVNRSIQEDQIDYEHMVDRIGTNILYADTEMIKRYHVALFSGRVKKNLFISDMGSYIDKNLHMVLKGKSYELINIEPDTVIDKNIWN